MSAKRIIKPKKKGETSVKMAQPVRNTFAMGSTSKSISKPTAHPVQQPQQPLAQPQVYQTTPKQIPVKKPLVLTPKIKIKVDLTQLIANGFTDVVGLTGSQGQYVATVYLNGNDMYIYGQGTNVLEAIEDLNQKVIALNFEI